MKNILRLWALASGRTLQRPNERRGFFGGYLSRPLPPPLPPNHDWRKQLGTRNMLYNTHKWMMMEMAEWLSPCLVLTVEWWWSSIEKKFLIKHVSYYSPPLRLFWPWSRARIHPFPPPPSYPWFPKLCSSSWRRNKNFSWIRLKLEWMFWICQSYGNS